MALTRSSTPTTTPIQAPTPEQTPQEDAPQELAWLGALINAGSNIHPLAAYAIQSQRGNDALRALLKTDGDEAAERLDGMKALTPEERTSAMSAMSDDEFQAMVDDLPEERRHELGGLLEATDDPERKLTLWSEEQRAVARAKMEDPNPTTQATGASMLEEIDDELAHLERERERSGEIGAESVDELVARKAQERALEEIHGVNLTNARADDSWLGGLQGEDPEAGRRVWSQEEMAAMAEGLGALPEGVLAANGITEIARTGEGSGEVMPEDGRMALSDEACANGVTGSTLHGVGHAVYAQGHEDPQPSESEVFAADYARNVTDPEGLQQDMVGAPRARMESMYDAWQQKVQAQNANTDPSQGALLAVDAEKAKAAFQEQQDAAQRQEQSWYNLQYLQTATPR